MLNRATLIGNLGSDPEVKEIANGKVANFSIATSETFKDKQGVKQEKTEWHRIVCFGNVAEIAEKYLAKGKRVYIEGKIKTREWEDKAGTKKYTTEILAQTVRMLDRKSDGESTAPVASQNGNSKKEEKKSSASVASNEKDSTTNNKANTPSFIDSGDEDLPF